jgi:hypothetical protein
MNYDLLPKDIDLLDYEHWSQMKNPTLRIALLRGYIGAYKEAKQSIETILDNWLDDQQGGFNIRNQTSNCLNALESLNLASRYMDDSSDVIRKKYEQSGLYDEIHNLMKDVLHDNTAPPSHRLQGLALLVNRDQNAQEILDESALILSQGRLLKNNEPIREGAGLEWSFSETESMKLRMHVLQLLLSVAEHHPYHAEAIVDIITQAALQDIHPDVRNASSLTLRVLATENSCGQYIPRIKAAFNQMIHSDPAPEVRKSAEKNLNRLSSSPAQSPP